MQVPHISLRFLKFWEAVKQVFSMQSDFPSPPNLEQYESSEEDRDREETRHIRMRHSYRYW